MVHTKKMPRDSTGGRKPRKQIRTRPPNHFQFQDHAGSTYTVVCHGRSSGPGSQKLSIQLYFLGAITVLPGDVGDNIIDCKALENSRYRPRVDIYAGFASIDECIEHHRREKAFRQKAVRDMRRAAVEGLSEEAGIEKLLGEVRGLEPLPHIVPTWCASAKFWTEYDRGDRYRSLIFVAPEDCHSWQDVVEKGLFQVRFDLEVTPAMETDMLDEDAHDDSCLVGEKHGWVLVERSGVEKCEPVESRLLCLRDYQGKGDYSDWDIKTQRYTWQTPGSRHRFSDAWDNAMYIMRDCTYREGDCDDCSQGQPHTLCEAELDEHYLDDDGQCIACRRKEEYRRRSKRIATRTKGG